MAFWMAAVSRVVPSPLAPKSFAENIFGAACAERVNARIAARLRVRLVVLVIWPPPPRGKVCKVFEVETLGLDFGMALNGEVRRAPDFFCMG